MSKLTKAKKPSPPPTQAPMAQVIEEGPAGDDEVRKTRRRSGYEKTILTGALAPSVGGRTILG